MHTNRFFTVKSFKVDGDLELHEVITPEGFRVAVAAETESLVMLVDALNQVMADAANAHPEVLFSEGFEVNAETQNCIDCARFGMSAHAVYDEISRS